MKSKNYKKLGELKRENIKLLFTINLKCADCFGYFADGYQKCDFSTCPLFSYFPTVRRYNSLIKTRKCQEGKDEAFSRS